MSTLRVQAAALKSYMAEIMRAHGVDGEQADSVSSNLVWSELIGRENFGVNRLPIHMKRVKARVLQCPCRPCFERISDSIGVLDGDNGFGHHVAQLGMRHAIELARRSGVGVVGVRNSNFYGVGAFFVQQAAESKMVGIAASNSFPKVVAHNGLMPILGTNPLAFAAPRRNGESLMVDMATSALAGSTVRKHIARNTELPTGLAIDVAGIPITDPNKVAEGALLPFGGAKGFGLSLLVEILAGVITGAGISHGVASLYKNFSEGGHSGHFLMALDVSRFMPLETYYDRLEYLLEIVKSSHPGQEVLLPGEVRWRNFRQNSRFGISLDSSAAQTLLELARPYGIVAPWQQSSIVNQRSDMPQVSASSRKLSKAMYS